jgi:hypothetical protein
MAYGIAAVPVLSAACGGSNTGDDTSTGDDSGDDGTSTVDARPTADAGGASDTWASGGKPNTTFANDNIMSAIPSSQRAALILDYARMTDGAMLASKIVTVTG